MTTLTQASHQWATRPDDQRFTSLYDMQSFLHAQRRMSAARVVPSKALEAHPVDGDSRALVVTGPNGVPVAPTHWSFGQLAQRAGAPASYIRELPSALAADCINYGLVTQRENDDLGVLLYKPEDGAAQLRAVTGPNYGRVWNSSIVDALVQRVGDGVSGDFRVPGEFGARVEVTKENTTLFASDRDMFIFLADEENRIEVPNRRDGQPGSLARGFFLWNSEVGSRSLGIATFLFDYVCSNRIVWGALDYTEVRLRHTSGAPARWIDEVYPAIESYVHSSAQPITALIEDARTKKIGDDVDAFLKSRKFSGAQAAAIKAAHLSEEGRPIESLWDASVGITAYAKGIQYQDARVEIEREAGKVLALAA